MKSAADLKKISVLILDVDGVLTDGRFGYGGGSEHEIKFFHSRDGLGIRFLRTLGVKVGIISGRKSLANEKRARELQLDFIKEECKVKLDAYLELLSELSVRPENCMYIGDDLIDLAVMKRVGLSVAVADATQEVKDAADWVMEAPGGHGAVREAIERLIKERGQWQQILALYE